MEANDTTYAPEPGSDSSFLTAPFSGKNAFWRYFVGVIIPFLAANFIGALPLAAVIIINSLDGAAVPQKGGMPDFEAMGIDLNVGFVLTVVPFLLGLLAIILLIKPLHNRKFMTVVNGGRKVRWGRMLFAALVWIVVSSLWMLYALRSDPGNFRLNNSSNSLIILAVLALTLIPFQAAFEEILFRGYLMQGFAVMARNRWVPILFTSVLFGLMHGLNPEVQRYGFLTMMPQYIFFGLVFAVVTMFDDGIELAIGAHAANNIFLSILITHDDMALQTPAMYEQIGIYPWKEFGGLVIQSLIFIVILAIVFRWKDVRKLFARIRVPKGTAGVSDAVDAG
jgi:hypothetical protein